MAGPGYDVIVVGARCAGSPLAMLLARYGHRVLLLDRATFPSDTVSTHVVQPTGVAALKRWGLLDQVVASGCPPIHTYGFDFGPFMLAGSPGTPESPVAYAPRRIVLDSILVEAAAASGAEIRQGFTVEGVVVEDGVVVGIRGHSKAASSVTERAQFVVGADGLHSVVAKSVRPKQYHDKPQLLCGYYSYWSDLPMEGHFDTYIRAERGWAAAPTNDGLTMVVVGWPFAEFAANKPEFEAHYLKAFELVPEFAERVRSATRVERIVGTAVANYFRQPYGPGWALVGDAGYNKDFVTAQGISDAFRDAELCATALHQTLTGASSFGDAMAAYQSTRDEQVLPMYDFTLELASMAEPPPEQQRLLAAIHGNQAAMDGFARVNAGTTSPAEFFAPENVEKIFAESTR